MGANFARRNLLRVGMITLYVLSMGMTALQAVTYCPRDCECIEQRLNCQGRGLQRVPDFPSRMSPLLLVDLSRNNISVIRLDDIGGLISRVFDVSQNRIRTIVPLSEADLDVFVHVEATMNMSHNMMTSFPVEFVSIMPFVDAIDLSYNAITSLSAAVILHNADVEVMTLSHNRLVHVHPQAFVGPRKLKKLDLRYNFLTKFAPTLDVIADHLLLGGNPWICDCNERWMLDSSLITDSPSPPICSQPPAVTGRSVVSLQREEFVCAPRYNNGSLLVQSNLGGKVELICPAEGDPPVTEVMWSFRGQHPSYRIASKPDKPLIIQAVTEATVGRYWCTVWNRGGNLTMSISLSVRRSDVPTSGPGYLQTTEELPTTKVRNGSQIPLPVASDFKVPILGIFALTSMLFLMFFIVMGLVGYTFKLRNRLKHKRSVAREGMFYWQSSFPGTASYTSTEQSTLPIDNGYMHLVRNNRHYRNHRAADITGYREEGAVRCRSLMLNPADYASTRKRMLPSVPSCIAPTLDPQGMAYGYDSHHMYDTLGAHCLSSCSESSGSQQSVAI